jgi:hypothetical protein
LNDAGCAYRLIDNRSHERRVFALGPGAFGMPGISTADLLLTTEVACCYSDG